MTYIKQHRYEFSLANGETRYLITPMDINELKNNVKNNNWIELYHSGVINDFHKITATPKQAEVQTCNIVHVVEDEQFGEKMAKDQAYERERERIVNQINRRKLGFIRKIIFNIKVSTVYQNPNYKDKLYNFNLEYLNKLKIWVQKHSKN